MTGFKDLPLELKWRILDFLPNTDPPERPAWPLQRSDVCGPHEPNYNLYALQGLRLQGRQFAREFAEPLAKHIKRFLLMFNETGLKELEWASNNMLAPYVKSLALADVYPFDLAMMMRDVEVNKKVMKGISSESIYSSIFGSNCFRLDLLETRLREYDLAMEDVRQRQDTDEWQLWDDRALNDEEVKAALDTDELAFINNSESLDRVVGLLQNFSSIQSITTESVTKFMVCWKPKKNSPETNAQNLYSVPRHAEPLIFGRRSRDVPYASPISAVHTLGKLATRLLETTPTWGHKVTRLEFMIDSEKKSSVLTQDAVVNMMTLFPNVQALAFATTDDRFCGQDPQPGVPAVLDDLIKMFAKVMSVSPLKALNSFKVPRDYVNEKDVLTILCAQKDTLSEVEVKDQYLHTHQASHAITQFAVLQSMPKLKKLKTSLRWYNAERDFWQAIDVNDWLVPWRTQVLLALDFLRTMRDDGDLSRAHDWYYGKIYEMRRAKQRSLEGAD